MDYGGDPHSVGVKSVLDAIAADEELTVAKVEKLGDRRKRSPVRTKS